MGKPKSIVLRLKDDEGDLIESVKKVQNCAVATKAVIRACRGFLAQRDELRHKDELITKLRLELADMRSEQAHTDRQQLDLELDR